MRTSAIMVGRRDTPPGSASVYAIAVTLSILGLIVLLLVLVEVRSFRSGRALISRRRLSLRIAAGVLLLTLLAAVFIGLFVLRLTGAQERPQAFFVYWSSCLLVAIVLIWVMLADLQHVESRYSARQQEIWRDMARFVAEQTASEEGQAPAAKDENSE
jgi:uncharacterized membrane protein